MNRVFCTIRILTPMARADKFGDFSRVIQNSFYLNTNTTVPICRGPFVPLLTFQSLFKPLGITFYTYKKVWESRFRDRKVPSRYPVHQSTPSPCFRSSLKAALTHTKQAFPNLLRQIKCLLTPLSFLPRKRRVRRSESWLPRQIRVVFKMISGVMYAKAFI